MSDFIWRIAFESDGLVVGFAAGAILSGVLVAAIAYEAGRRRAHAEVMRLAAHQLRQVLDIDLDLEPTVAPIVPRWPRDAA
jgi:hypothetical protein